MPLVVYNEILDIMITIDIADHYQLLISTSTLLQIYVTNIKHSSVKTHLLS